jgi:hypothetical protein
MYDILQDLNRPFFYTFWHNGDSNKVGRRQDLSPHLFLKERLAYEFTFTQNPIDTYLS